MIKKQIVLIALFALFSSCGTSQSTSKNINLIFDDVTNFWNMYDKVKQIEDDTKRVEIIKNDYLKKATFGLKLLIFDDNLKALQYSNQLKDTVFYNSIRKTTNDIQADSVKIISYIHQFEKLDKIESLSN